MQTNVFIIDNLREDDNFNAVLEYLNSLNEFIYKNTALVFKMNVKLNDSQTNFIQKNFKIKIVELVEKEHILSNGILYHTNKNFEVLHQNPKKIVLKGDKKIVHKNSFNPLHNIEAFKDKALKSLAYTNTNYLITTDITGKIVYFNDAFCQKFDINYHESIGEKYTSFVFPQDNPNVHEIIWNLLNNVESSVIFEVKYEKLNQKITYLKWEFFPIRDDSQTIIGLQGIGQDITIQKINEYKLCQEKDFLSSIIDSANLGTWEWNIQKNKIRFNHKWTEILGFEKLVWTFEEWQELIFKEDRKKVLQTLEKVKNGNQDFYEIQHRKIDRDGNIKWLLLSGKGIDKDEYGKPTKILGIHQDITDKKETEILVKIIEERNKSIFDNMQEGLVIQDLQGKIIACNQSAEKILGLSLDQMLGKTSTDPHWRAIKENGEPFPGEEHPAMQTLKTRIPQQNVIMGVYRSKDNFVWLSVNSNLLTYPDTQEPYAVFTIFHDITESKKLEISLQNSEKKYREIIETQSDFVLLSAPDTTIQFANYSLSKMMGISAEEMIGLKWIDFANPDDIKDIEQKLKALTPENNTFLTENRDKRFDGKWGWTQWINQGLFDQLGNLIQIQSIGRDITAIKEAQEQILKQNEELAASEEEIRVNFEEILTYQEKLKDSELKLKAILNSTNDINILLDKDLKILSFNKITETFIKTIQNKTIKVNDSLLDFFDNETISNLEKNLQKAIEGDIITNELVIKNKSGNKIWLLAKYYPVIDSENSFVGVSLNLIDITNKKNIEEQLAESQKVFQIMADNAPVMIWVAGIDKLCYYFNKVWLDFTGRKLEEEINNGWLESVHPEDAGYCMEIYESSFNERVPFVMDYRLKRHDGEYRWIIDNGVPRFTEKGEFLGYIGSCYDITDRKKLEDDLIKQRKKFQDIVDSTDGIVWEADFKTFQFTYVSQKAERLLGYQIEEWYKPNFWVEHLHPEDKQEAINFCTFQSKNLENHEFEYRFLNKNGGYVWLRDIVTIVLENQKPKLLRGIMIDITRQKRIENKMIAYNNRLTQLKKFIDEGADAIQVADAKGNLVYINKVASERLGIDADDLHKYKVHDFEYIFQQTDTWEKYVQFLKEKQIFIVEGININQKTGEFFPAEVTIKYVVVDDKEYIIASSRDITERKKLEREKIEILTRLEETTKHIPGYIYQFCLRSDGSSYFPYISEGVTKLLDIDIEEMKKNAQGFYASVLKEDIAAINSAIILSAKRLSNWKVEWRSKTKNGDIIWLEGYSSPQKLENGDIVWYGYTNDITKRKMMEEELKKLSLVAQKTYNSVIITDVEKKIIWVNEGFTRITKYTLEEVIGKTPKIFQFEQTDMQVVALVNQSIEKQEPIRFEILNKGKFGDIYWLDVEIQPVFDNKNKLTGFMAIQTDITERKLREKQIQEQNETLKQIAFVQSHTLRRPIANILGLINLIKDEDKNTEMFDMYIQYLEKSAKETDEVIHQIVQQINKMESID